MKGIYMRDMGEEDIDRILTLGSGEERFRSDSGGEFWSEEILKGWTKSKRDVTLVTMDCEEMVGFLLMAYHPVLRKATFENVFVEERYRGKGLARSMYEIAEGRVRNSGAKFICGFVETDNPRSGKFLERQGYSNAGKFNWMHKDLSKR